MYKNLLQYMLKCSHSQSETVLTRKKHTALGFCLKRLMITCPGPHVVIPVCVLRKNEINVDWLKQYMLMLCNKGTSRMMLPR